MAVLSRMMSLNLSARRTRQQAVVALGLVLSESTDAAVHGFNITKNEDWASSGVMLLVAVVTAAFLVSRHQPECTVVPRPHSRGFSSIHEKYFFPPLTPSQHAVAAVALRSQYKGKLSSLGMGSGVLSISYKNILYMSPTRSNN